MRFIALSACLAFVIAGSAHAAPGSSGLRGVVTRGPVAPVCAAEGPCDEPAVHVTLVFSRADHVAGRALTDPLGRYHLRLPAGLYSVRRAASSGIDRRLDPNRVRVYAGRFTRVDFSIETGIR